MELVKPIDNGSYNKNNKRKGFKVNKDLLFYCLLLLWPVLQFCVFYIFVNFNSILLVFQHYDGLSSKFVWNTKGELFSNFANAFSNTTATPKEFISMIGKSALSWACGLFFGTFFAAVFSYYIFSKRKGSKIFKFILFLPSVIPSILLTLIYYYMTKDAIPEVMKIIFKVNDFKELLDPSYKSFYPMVLAFNVLTGFGSQILLYCGAMEQINPSLMEAAKLDGCSPFRAFIHIVVPSIMPTLGTFLVAGVALFFTNQANLYNFWQAQLGSDYRTQMNIGYFLFWFVTCGSETANKANYPVGAALGIICTAIAIPLTLLMRKFVKRWEN